MAYGTPVDPVPGTVITVAYQIANVLDPIRALRANTGNGDPPALNRVAVSSAPGGPSAWIQVPTGAIADAAITDAKLAVAKVNRTQGSYTGFGLAAPGLAGFFDIDNSSGDGPPGGAGAYMMMQLRHWNTSADLRFQLATNTTAGDQVWIRSVLNGTNSPWRRLYHQGFQGVGSGLDAERLAGQPSTYYAPASNAVPPGLIAAFPSAFAIAAGWSRFTAGDGKFLVGAGTSFGQSFSEGASAGSSWDHLHGTTGTTVQSGTGASAAAAANTANARWIPPSFTVVWAQKT